MIDSYQHYCELAFDTAVALANTENHGSEFRQAYQTEINKGHEPDLAVVLALMNCGMKEIEI